MEKTFSTAVAAKVLNVDLSSVINWIDKKLLRADRTPGGHRRIHIEDLAEFLRAHDMRIPPEIQQPPARG